MDTTKTYADLYVVQCNSMTGVRGRALLQGEAYPANAFINIDDHIAAKDILPSDIHESNLALKIEQEEAQLKKDKEANAK